MSADRVGMNSRIVISESKSEREINSIPNGLVKPSYNRLSENVRKITPSEIICAMFCGGRKCKYENSSWSKTDMAVDGIYSHWVTDDLLAMARPNTEMINKRNILGQFIKFGIKSIINLQVPGEHARCGPPLTKCGFSYDPEVFMKNDIYYYNFGWKDYGHSTLQGLLNVVKVMAFASSQGKIAIHCHAGLGRTGVLLACYLVYSLRVRANHAIRYVRSKRANAVQTRGQIMCVQEFEQFLIPYSRIYSIGQYVKSSQRKNHQPFCLEQHIEHQHILMHGYEARALRYIPKIIYVICERLLILCQANEVQHRHINYSLQSKTLPFSRHFFSNRFDSENSKRLPYCDEFKRPQSPNSSFNAGGFFKSRPSDLLMTDINDDSSSSTIDLNSRSSATPSAISHSGTLEDLLDSTLDSVDVDMSNNQCYHELSSQMDLHAVLNKEKTKLSRQAIIEAILADPALDNHQSSAVKEYCLQMNGRVSLWIRLASESNPEILIALLWKWLLHLRQPILSNDELSMIVIFSHKPDKCFSKFDQATRYTIEYILRFVQRLFHFQGNAEIKQADLNDVMSRIISVLTHQAVEVRQIIFPIDESKKRLGRGTYKKIVEFFRNTTNLIEEIDSSSHYLISDH